MLKIKFIFFELLAIAMLTTNAYAADVNNLNGMWILDSAATEKFVANSPMPSDANDLAQWFMIAGGYMALFSYQFDGKTVIEDAYGGRGKKTEYRLLSNQEADFNYKQANVATGAETHTLSVSVLENGHLKIVKAGLDGMTYLLWKKSPVTNEHVTKDEVMAASKVWIKSMGNIVELLHRAPK